MPCATPWIEAAHPCECREGVGAPPHVPCLRTRRVASGVDGYCGPSGFSLDTRAATADELQHTPAVSPTPSYSSAIASRDGAAAPENRPPRTSGGSQGGAIMKSRTAVRTVAGYLAGGAALAAVGYAAY